MLFWSSPLTAILDVKKQILALAHQLKKPALQVNGLFNSKAPILIFLNSNDVIIITIVIQSNLPLRPPLVSDHLAFATTFPKYQKFSSQITIDGTSRRRPPLVSNHF